MRASRMELLKTVSSALKSRSRSSHQVNKIKNSLSLNPVITFPSKISKFLSTSWASSWVCKLNQWALLAMKLCRLMTIHQTKISPLFTKAISRINLSLLRELNLREIWWSWCNKSLKLSCKRSSRPTKRNYISNLALTVSIGKQSPLSLSRPNLTLRVCLLLAQRALKIDPVPSPATWRLGSRQTQTNLCPVYSLSSQRPSTEKPRLS